VETIDLSRASNQDRIVRAVDPEDYKLDVRKFLA
jgi:hypothetical protein